VAIKLGTLGEARLAPTYTGSEGEYPSALTSEAMSTPVGAGLGAQ